MGAMNILLLTGPKTSRARQKNGPHPPIFKGHRQSPDHALTSRRAGVYSAGGRRVVYSPGLGGQARIGINGTQMTLILMIISDFLGGTLEE